ncbi:Na-Ca exchanger/integrin-beta4 [Thalassoporum mexicanum PCC 7367]|uniref:Calx-beta domain-containing protein n=1 Tax=Thalassoporum mexicanum TaxID=3457544 RepID=UPI00029FB5A5|nr:Calx-beta domain-containing protein [Pseudanabaena sp. PCC 7367]AFY68492.1 Na-Ca exchanger/integrin-beta4 [Pseudanabaena sp. PCC 7367]
MAIIFGTPAGDFLDGTSEADTIVGGSGDDAGRGFDNSDRLEGNQGADTLNGNQGSDVVFGGQGVDLLYGGKGDDFVSGDKDSDFLLGNFGEDTILGGPGSDSLFGGQQSDELFGDEGNDALFGDLGTDTLTGGGGGDTFVIGRDTGTDTITDFSDGTDLIGLLDGITPADLTITQDGSDTVITLTDSGAILAVLSNTAADTIGVEDFIATSTITGPPDSPGSPDGPIASVVSVVAADQFAEEFPAAQNISPTRGRFVISRDNIIGDLTVFFSLSGTATNIADYEELPTSVVIPDGQRSVELIVTAIDDALVEEDETVVLTIDPGPNYTIGRPNDNANDTAATVIIRDNEPPIPPAPEPILPTVGIEATDSGASELTGDKGFFTITLSEAVATPVVVPITIPQGEGFSTNGIDYVNIPSSVTIPTTTQTGVVVPAGATSVIIEVVPVDDVVGEAEENVTVQIGAPAGFALATGLSEATVVLTDEPIIFSFFPGTIIDDRITGSDPTDPGELGDDRLLGGPGDDRIFGRGGSDQLFGDDPDDAGVSGDDSINGGEGNDLITGGPGRDTLTGGLGNDSFIYVSPDEGIDVITDFEQTAMMPGPGDGFVLSSSGFGGTLTIGSFIAADEFQDAPSLAGIAIETTARILYIEDTGRLFFTPTGIGAAGALPGDAIQIANVFTDFGALTPPVLDENDFQIIS